MPRRSLTTRAFLASLILHVLLGLLTWNHDFLRVPEAAAVEDADAVTLLLEPAAGEDDVLSSGGILSDLFISITPSASNWRMISNRLAANSPIVNMGSISRIFKLKP